MNSVTHSRFPHAGDPSNAYSPIATLIEHAQSKHPDPIMVATSVDQLLGISDRTAAVKDRVRLSMLTQLGSDHWQAVHIDKKPLNEGNEQSVAIFDSLPGIQPETPGQREAIQNWEAVFAQRPNLTGRLFFLGTQHDATSSGDFAVHSLRKVRKLPISIDNLHKNIRQETYDPQLVIENMRRLKNDRTIFMGPTPTGPENLWLTNNLALIERASPHLLAKLIIHNQIYRNLAAQQVKWDLGCIGMPTKGQKDLPCNLLKRFNNKGLNKEYSMAIYAWRKKAIKYQNRRRD